MIMNGNGIPSEREQFNRELKSERIHYRAPFSNVIITARIAGCGIALALPAALEKVRGRHPLLRARIRLDHDGSAWFVPNDNVMLPLEVCLRGSDKDWIEKAADEQHKPFALDKGPLIRFILLEAEDVSDLLIICHHTICDGMSLVFLVRDIMTCLGNPEKILEPLPVPPVLDLSCFSGSKGPGLLPRMVLGHFNKAWGKSKTVFGEEDYRRIHCNFWQDETMQIEAHTFFEDQLAELASRSKAEGVTVNSAVCTAFTIAQHAVQQETHSDFGKTGVAVNLRSRMNDSPGEGMGLFAGGSAVGLAPGSGKPFWELAREFDKQVRKMLSSEHKLYEILLFNLLDPSLLDALYFKLFGGFENKIAASFAKLTHFDRKRASLGTTNLGRVAIPPDYGRYRLDALFFAPSNIPGGDKIIGIVTAGCKMNVCLVTLRSDMNAAVVGRIMDFAVKCLEEALSLPRPISGQAASPSAAT